MIVIEESFIPLYFCSQDGKFYEEAGNCTLCGLVLQETEPPYSVKRICNNCNEKFEASVEYFDNNTKCPSCNVGNLITLPSRDTHHFIFNGEWDGKPMGKKIRERNEELKKKNAGYSYENTPSIREKTQDKYEKRHNF